MIIFAPRRISHKNKTVIILTAVFIAILIVLLFVESLIRPTVSNMARATAVNTATNAIYESIYEIFSEESITYSDLVTAEKGNDGSIISLSADTAKINILKSDIIKSINELFSSFETKSFSVPIGNFTGVDILLGRGPRIPFKLIPVNITRSEFSSSFTSAGINQTVHKIQFEIIVNVSVIMKGHIINQSVKTVIPVTETVIVGNVPEYYFNFNNGSLESLQNMIIKE